MAKTVEQRRLRKELSEKAVAFYEQHDVAKTVEKLLNEMFVAAPKDVYGYMSEYFSDLAVAPIISGARCMEGMDERGGRALDVSIHCTVHGVDRHVASVSVPINPNPPPPPPPPTSPSKSGAKKKASAAEIEPETGEEGAGDKEDATEDPFESFSAYISPALLSRSPSQQSDIDNVITSLRNKDGKELHCSSLLATSLAVAQSAAHLSDIPLYTHLISTLPPLHQPSAPLSLPIPVSSLLAGGCGKLRVKEFCVVPLPGRSLSEQMSALSSVHSSVGALLSAKSGGAVLASGVHCPVLDKLESGVELARDAVAQSRLTLGEDLSVLIDIGADRLFDQEKFKYELVTGQWKSTDEVISVYSDLLTSHPGITGYIDPLHHKDIEGWKKLHKALGSKCLLVADKALEAGLPLSLRRGSSGEVAAAAVERDEGASEELDFVSCASLSLKTTLTATLSRCAVVRGSAKYIMFSVPPTLTVNPLLVDLAVAMQCALFRIGASCGLTSTCLMSRMLRIRDELSAKGNYEPAKALVFSCSSLSQLDQQ